MMVMRMLLAAIQLHFSNFLNFFGIFIFFRSEPVILGEHSMPSLLHSSSVDDRKTVVHLSNEQINAEPTTIHLSCDDLPPPEPPVDYDVEDNIIREKLQKEISKGLL